MFDITGNSTLSTPFYVAMLTVGSNPGANMGFGHFIQEVGAVNWRLNHQSSFVKKWKAPETFQWCNPGFPVQISRWRLTKKISWCNPAELFSLECSGQARSQNLCFSYRRVQETILSLEPQGPGSAHKENTALCHPSGVAAVSSAAKCWRPVWNWSRSQRRLGVLHKAPVLGWAVMAPTFAARISGQRNRKTWSGCCCQLFWLVGLMSFKSPIIEGFKGLGLAAPTKCVCGLCNFRLLWKSQPQDLLIPVFSG